MLLCDNQHLCRLKGSVTKAKGFVLLRIINLHSESQARETNPSAPPEPKATKASASEHLRHHTVQAHAPTPAPHSASVPIDLCATRTPFPYMQAGELHPTQTPLPEDNKSATALVQRDGKREEAHASWWAASAKPIWALVLDKRRHITFHPLLNDIKNMQG